MTESPNTPEGPVNPGEGASGRLAWLDLGQAGPTATEDVSQIAVLLDKLESLIHDLVELEIDSLGLAERYMPPELSIIGMVRLSSGAISSGTHMMVNLIDGLPTEHSIAMTSMLSIDKESASSGFMRWHIVLDGEILAERDFMADDPWVINQEALDESIERGDLDAHLERLKILLGQAIQVHEPALEQARRLIAQNLQSSTEPVIRVALPEPEEAEDLRAHVAAQELIEQIMRRPGGERTGC